MHTGLRRTTCAAIRVVTVSVTFAVLSPDSAFCSAISRYAQSGSVGRAGTAALIETPLEYDGLMVGMPVVRAMVNGSKPVRFVVDTGAPAAVIFTNEGAQRLGLTTVTPKDSSTVIKGGKALSPAKLRFVARDGKSDQTLGAEAEVTAFQPDQLQIRALESDFGGERPVGIIGAELLEHFVAQFDCYDHLLCLYRIGTLTPTAPGTAAFDLAEAEGKRYVALRPDGKRRCDLWLDTGAEGTTLPDAVLVELRPLAVEVTHGRDAKRELEADLALVPEFSLGPFIVRNIGIMAEFNGSKRGRLGMDVLSRFKFTIDFSKNRVTLEPTPAAGQPIPVVGSGGLTVERRNDGDHFTFVDPDHPAAAAGLRVGDRLIEVDGRDNSRLDASGLGKLLSGIAGTKATLQVAHENGDHVTIIFVRESIFKSSLNPHGRVGLSLYFSKNGRRMVSGVANPSPAANAGIRPWDEIVELNGKATARMSLEDIAAVMKSSEGAHLEVAVRRKGQSELIRMTLVLNRMP